MLVPQEPSRGNSCFIVVFLKLVVSIKFINGMRELFIVIDAAICLGCKWWLHYKDILKFYSRAFLGL